MEEQSPSIVTSVIVLYRMMNNKLTYYGSYADGSSLWVDSAGKDVVIPKGGVSGGTSCQG